MRGNRVISHYAKHYRGLFLRAIAKARVESLEALEDIAIEGLSLEAIQTKAKTKELLYRVDG